MCNVNDLRCTKVVFYSVVKSRADSIWAESRTNTWSKSTVNGTTPVRIRWPFSSSYYVLKPPTADFSRRTADW